MASNPNPHVPGLLSSPPLPAAGQPTGARRQNRRRGGNRRAQPRAEQSGPPTHQADFVPGGGPPRPTHLQTVSTPERNDPLWTSGVAGASLQPDPNLYHVYSGAEHLPLVVSVTHTTCVNASASYGRRIPESALGYYCAVLTYARMLSLAAGNSMPISADERSFVEQVHHLFLSPPLLLAQYLAGFGNTKVPSCRGLRFALREREYLRAGDVPGWFGRVSPQTQPLYQSYPCLGVYGARILADLAPGEQLEWDLPVAIRPLEYVAGSYATTALLGYGLRTILSRTQREMLAVTNVRAGYPFPSMNQSLPFAIDLLLAVQSELSGVPGLRTTSLPSTLTGSLAQIPVTIISGEIDQNTVSYHSLRCLVELPDEVTYPASCFGYRVQHDVFLRPMAEVEGEDEAGPDAVQVGDVPVPLAAQQAPDLEEPPFGPWVVWRFTGVRPQAYWDYFEAGNALRDDEPDLLKITTFRTTEYLVRTRLENLERALRERAG